MSNTNSESTPEPGLKVLIQKLHNKKGKDLSNSDLSFLEDRYQGRPLDLLNDFYEKEGNLDALTPDVVGNLDQLFFPDSRMLSRGILEKRLSGARESQGSAQRFGSQLNAVADNASVVPTSFGLGDALALREREERESEEDMEKLIGGIVEYSDANEKLRDDKMQYRPKEDVAGGSDYMQKISESYYQPNQLLKDPKSDRLGRTSDFEKMQEMQSTQGAAFDKYFEKNPNYERDVAALDQQRTTAEKSIDASWGKLRSYYERRLKEESMNNKVQSSLNPRLGYQEQYIKTPKYKSLEAIVRNGEKLLEYLHAPEKGGFALRKLVEGMGDADWKSVFTLGFSQLAPLAEESGAYKRVAEAQKNGQVANAEDLKLVEMMTMANQISSSKDPSILYEIGKAAPEQIAFFVEMALTSGVSGGVSRAARKTLGKIAESSMRKVPKAVAKGGVKLGEVVVGGSVQSLAMPHHIAANYAENKKSQYDVGYGADGSLQVSHDYGESSPVTLLRSVVQNAIEITSEKAGGVLFDPVLKPFGRFLRPNAWSPTSRLGLNIGAGINYLSQRAPGYLKGTVASAAGMADMDGMLGEYSEEVLGKALNTVLPPTPREQAELDAENAQRAKMGLKPISKWQGFFDSDEMLTTVGTILLTSGVTRGVGGQVDLLQKRKDLKDAMHQMPVEVRNDVVRAMSGGTLEDVRRNINALGLDKLNFTSDEQHSVERFVAKKFAYDMVTGAKLSKEMVEVQKGVKSDVESITHGSSRKIVVVDGIDGKNYAVVDGNLSALGKESSGPSGTYIVREVVVDESGGLVLGEGGNQQMSLSDIGLGGIETAEPSKVFNSLVNSRLGMLVQGTQEQLERDIIEFEEESYESSLPEIEKEETLYNRGAEMMLVPMLDDEGEIQESPLESGEGLLFGSMVGERLVRVFVIGKNGSTKIQGLMDAKQAREVKRRLQLNEAVGQAGNEVSEDAAAPSPTPSMSAEVAPGVVSGEELQGAPVAPAAYPLNKNGEVDFDLMSGEQLIRYAEENLSEKEVFESVSAQAKAEQQKLDSVRKKFASATIPQRVKLKNEESRIQGNLKIFEAYLGQKSKEQSERIQREVEQEREGRGQSSPALDSSNPIVDRWTNAPKVMGHEMSLPLPGGKKLKGRYVLTVQGAATASHDASRNFAQSEGFPTTETGGSINDRDYTNKNAQNVEIEKAQEYDGRAVTNAPKVQDGIVIDGNGRTIAGQIASSSGKDGLYIDSLKENAHIYGFTEDQVAEMAKEGSPRLYFEVAEDSKLPLTPETFALFNEQETKTQSQTEQTVKYSKLVTKPAAAAISEVLGRYESLEALYRSELGSSELLSVLERYGLMNANQRAQYRKSDVDSSLSVVGQEFFENVLVGAVLEEDAVKWAQSNPFIRRAIVKAISPLVENGGLDPAYTLREELSEAVVVLSKALHGGVVKYGEATDLIFRQVDAFDKSVRGLTVQMFTHLLNRKDYDNLKKVVSLYNRSALLAQAGQGDLFTGEVATKEQISLEILNSEGYDIRFITPNSDADSADASGETGAVRRDVSSGSTGEAGGDVQAVSSSDGSGTSGERRERSGGTEGSIEGGSFFGRLKTPPRFGQRGGGEDVVKLAERLSKKLGSKVNLVESREALREIFPKAKEEDLSRRKGWYDAKTGEVYLVVPNARGDGDVTATILHEMVGHKGLRALLGDDFDRFLDSAYQKATRGIQRKIDVMVKAEGLSLRAATEEYLADLAENGFDSMDERSFIGQLYADFVKMLRDFGLLLNLDFFTEKDFVRLMWESQNNLEGKTATGYLDVIRGRAKMEENVERSLEKSEENRNFVKNKANAEYPSTYETQEGHTIRFRSWQEELSFAETDAGAKGSRHPMGVRGHADLPRPSISDRRGSSIPSTLRKLGEGEFAHVERIFTEFKAFEFFAPNKIESYEDVAYIFKQLEDESIENAFVVFVKEGVPTVLHVGMGKYASTNVHFSPIFVANERLGADEIYFVHNHPSGQLVASEADRRIHKSLSSIYGSKFKDSIIINTRTGQFATFSDAGTLVVDSKSSENVAPIVVHKFDKQVFSPEFDPREAYKIRGSMDVSQFLSSHRLGKRAKLNYLLLSTSGGVVGNVFSAYTKIDKKNSADVCKDLVSKATQLGATSVVLYGSIPSSLSSREVMSDLKSEIEAISSGEISLSDIISIEGDYQKYHSFRDEGDLRFRDTPAFAGDFLKGDGEGSRKASAGESAAEARALEEARIVSQAKADGTYMKAPNGAPTNLDAKQWVQVRTQAFKKWFGDWELKYKEVEVVDTPLHDFKNYAEAKQWAKRNIVGTYNDDETGGKGNIRISSNAIDKYLSKSSVEKSDNNDVHLSVLMVLQNVIRTSIIGETHADYLKGESGKRSPENGINENMAIRRLFGAVDIDGIAYRVKITVQADRSSKEAQKAHSYEAIKIELLAGQHGETVTSPRNSNNSISAAKLLKNVEKSQQKGKYLLDDHSKVVDANGEPRVVYHGSRDGGFSVFRDAEDKKKSYSPSGTYWFTKDKDNAKSYSGTVKNADYKNEAPGNYAVFLNMRDPYTMDFQGGTWEGDLYGKYEMYSVDEKGGYLETIYTSDGGYFDSKKEAEEFAKVNGISDYELKKDPFLGQSVNESAANAKEYGNDGLIALNIIDSGRFGEVESDDYVVFNSTQIKSATDNNGAYSEEDEDILFRIGNSRKREMLLELAKARPDMSEEQRLETVAEIEKLGEEVKRGGSPKIEKLAQHFVLKGTLILPEDNYKLVKAYKVAEKKGIDPFAFDNPTELIETYAEVKIRGERTNPDTVSAFSHKQVHEGGIVIYDVQDDRVGQAAVRMVIDTHWGEDANPWCLAARIEGSLEQAYRYWESYHKIPKRIAFLNGKLLAFNASNHRQEWWDRQDRSRAGVPITRKIENDALGRTGTVEYDVRKRRFGEVYTDVHKGNKENGVYEVWDDNGTLSRRENYKAGKLDGLREAWDENGTLSERANFKAGKEDGLREAWDDNGTLRDRENYKSGKLDGLYESWHYNGTLRERSNYKAGKLDGLRERWYDNGTLLERANYKFGKLDGLRERWYDNGTLRGRENYKDGKLDGLREAWDETGTLRGRENYKAGERDGMFESWYANGTLRERWNYKDDRLDGLREWWYDNGTLLERANFKDGFKDDSLAVKDDVRFRDTPAFAGDFLSGDGEGSRKASAGESAAEARALEESRIVSQAKADGTYMKAPNGAPTNLDAKQWVQVRTQAFKEWFGDWELTSLREFLLSSHVVLTLTGNEFQKDGVPLTEKVASFYKAQYNGSVERKGFGVVILDVRSVKDSISHGIGRLKSAAFAAVPSIIEKGRIVDQQRDWKGRGYGSTTFAAAIKIGSENYIGVVVVNETTTHGKRRFYLHEVILQKSLQDGEFKTGINTGSPAGSFIDESIKTDTEAGFHQGDIAKLIQKIVKTKNNSSKVVDANGEPRVVYHGSRSGGGFTVFSKNSFFTDDVNTADMFKREADYTLYINGAPVGMIGDIDAQELSEYISGYDYTPKDIVEWDEFNVEDARDKSSLLEYLRQLSNYKISEGDIQSVKIVPTPEMFKTFLSIKHPLVLDYKGEVWDTDNAPELKLKDAQSKGHDGIIALNIVEGGGVGEYRDGTAPIASTDYIALIPSQIKSATDNTGAFSGEDADIRFRIGNSRKNEMLAELEKSRSDMSEAQRVQTVDEIEKLGEEVKKGGNPKIEKLAHHFVMKGTLILPEDNYKLIKAYKIAEQKKIDPFAYSNPTELIETFSEVKLKDEKVNPDTVKEFSNKQVHESGIVIYDVQNDKAGQEAVRRIIDTHWGEDANPWCLAARIEGSLEQAYRYWESYHKIPKRIAFLNGKLLAFNASNHRQEWWDRQDRSSAGVPITRKIENDALGRTGTVEYDVRKRRFGEVYTDVHKGNKENGVYEVWDDNGTLSRRENYKAGERDGLYESWYADGTMLERANYKSGERDGLREKWYVDGRLRGRANYKSGKLDGLREVWYDNGTLRDRVNFTDGKEYGLREKWYVDGTLWGRENYKDGKLDGLIESWHKNGTLRGRMNYKDDRLDGLREVWEEDGTLRRRENYKDGERDGLHESWYADGTLSERANYKDDRLDGLREVWDDNGTLRDRENYTDGKLDGLRERWYDNGTLRERSNYKDDRLDGLREWWDDNGTLLERANYKDGFKDDSLAVKGDLRFRDTPSFAGDFLKGDGEGSRKSSAAESAAEARALEESRIVSQAKADGTYMKAPNGEPTNLDDKQWVQVRTQAFKKWFGDWEKAIRIEKLRKSKPIEITGEEYIGRYELNRDSAKQWLKTNVRGSYISKDTKEVISISRVGIDEVLSHGTQNEAHLKSLGVIPQLIEESVFIGEIPNTKGHDRYDSYRYYVVGLKIGGDDYTVKIVVGVKGDSKYYDHRLTEIEKGALVSSLNGLSNSVATDKSPLSDIKDTKLISILQNNSSKVVDANGEPMVVYHGTPDRSGFAVFDKNKAGKGNDWGLYSRGFYFSPNNSMAHQYRRGVGDIYVVFLKLNSPLYPSNFASKTALADYLDVSEDILEDSSSGYPVLSPYVGTYTSHIKDKGHDGVVVSRKGNTTEIEEVVVYEPTQIKSALDNNGAFSEEDADIYFRIGNSRKSSAGESAAEARALEESRIVSQAQADGTYMKAPNGEPTNLDDKQWVQVRTQAFKKWFGDWELKYKEVEVVPISEQFRNISQAREYAKKHLQGLTIINKDTQERILIGRNGIDKSFSGKAISQSLPLNVHLSAISRLDEIIENSILGEAHEDEKKNENIDCIQRFFGAIQVGEVIYRVKTTVKKIKEEDRGNPFYTYEIQEIEFLSERSTEMGLLGPDKESNSISATKLLKDVEKSKQRGKYLLGDHSKVVDANGEPKVVYHNSNEKRTIFDTKFVRKGLEIEAHFFASNPDEYGGYGEVEHRCFLNLRNPADHKTAYEGFRDKLSVSSSAGTEQREQLQSSGYDGGVKTDDDLPSEYFVFNSTQIKSATDNNGAYSGDDPNIYFRDSSEDSIRASSVEGMLSDYDRRVDSARSAYERAKRDYHSKFSELSPLKEGRDNLFAGDYLFSKSTVLGDLFGGDLSEFSTTEAQKKLVLAPYRRAMEVAKAQLNKLGVERSQFEERVRKFVDSQQVLFRDANESLDRLADVSEGRRDSSRGFAGDYLFGVADDGVRFRDSLEEVNATFNKNLRKQIQGELAPGFVYELGMPGAILRSAGVPNLPIEILASKLVAKSMQSNHIFELAEVENLAKSICKPLFIFESATIDNSFVIVTELSHGEKNFIAAVSVNRNKDKIEVNDIRSVHYRADNVHFAHWGNSGLLRYANKEKSSEWFSKQRYNSAEVKGAFRRFAKVVQNFENPKLSEENIRSRDADASEIAMPYRKGDRFMEHYTDSMLPLKKFQEWIERNGGVVTSDSDVYNGQNRAASRAMDADIRFEKKYMTALLEATKVLQGVHGGSTKGLELYMIAKHIPERNETMRGREYAAVIAELGLKGKTEEERQRILDENRAIIGAALSRDYAGASEFYLYAGQTPEQYVEEYESEVKSRSGNTSALETFWKSVNDATHFGVDYLTETGLMKPGTADMLKARWQYYVPLQGWQSGDDLNVGEYTQKIIFGTEFFKPRIVKGRKTLPDSPLANIQRNAHMAISQGETNRFRGQLLQLAKQNEALSDHIQVIDEKTKLAHANVKGGGYVKVYDKGTIQYVLFENNAEVASAINGDNLFKMAGYDVVINGLQWVGRATKGLTQMMTSKNPAFAVHNLLRDMQFVGYGYLIDKDPAFVGRVMKNYKYLVNSGMMWKDARGVELGDSELEQHFKEWKRLGGRTGFTSMKSIDDIKKSIDRTLNGWNKRRLANPLASDFAIWKALGEMGDAFEVVSTVSENATRFAVYMASLEGSKKVDGDYTADAKFNAITECKNASTNFDRRGSGSALLRAVYGFFNAQLQGTMRVLQIANKHKGRFMAAGGLLFAMGFLEAVLNARMGDDDEEYYLSLSDFDRATNLIFGKVRIPLPHFFRGIKNMGVQAYLGLRGKKDWQDALLNSVTFMSREILPDAINPLGDFEWDKHGRNVVLGNPREHVPTLFSPLFDVFMNENFAGYRVRPEYVENIPKAFQWTRSVNQPIKYASEYLARAAGGHPVTGKFISGGNHPMGGKEVNPWLDWNPNVIEFLITSYVPGVGQFAMDLFNLARNVVDGDVEIKNIPIANRIYKPRTDEQLEMKAYYDLKADADYFLKQFDFITGVVNNPEKILRRRGAEEFNANVDRAVIEFTELATNKMLPVAEAIQAIDKAGWQVGSWGKVNDALDAEGKAIRRQILLFKKQMNAVKRYNMKKISLADLNKVLDSGAE